MRLAALAIGAHFFLIFSVVTHLNEWIGRYRWLSPISIAIDYYAEVTFANRNFGFFAPSVTDDWSLDIRVTDTTGRERPYSLVQPNREMELKLYSMIGHSSESEDLADLFARSWALKAVNENPDVYRVDVVINQNRIPTMAQYRSGLRMGQEPYYRTAFILKDVPTPGWDGQRQ
jgi:hypothetical protein